MRSVRVPALVALTALVAVALAGCDAAFPAPGSTTQGRDIRSLYDILLVPVVVIFVLVEGILVWCLVRYRRGRDETLPPQTHGNNVLETAWTVIPLVVVLAAFGLSMETLGQVDALAASPRETIDVSAFQWYWRFQYVDHGVTVDGLGTQPELVLPVGETIRLNLHSDNVIHSFYVPQFLFKRDVVPGHDNQFDITIDDPGVYRGQCAEFCGLDHAAMIFSVRGVSPTEFTTWIEQQQAKASASAAASPSLGPNATTIELSASSTTSFDQSSVDGPANVAFAIHFSNKEAGVPHDVAIRDASGAVAFRGPIITGPSDTTYTIGPLKPGTSTFFCAVHPNMQGNLTIK